MPRTGISTPTHVGPKSPAYRLDKVIGQPWDSIAAPIRASTWRLTLSGTNRNRSEICTRFEIVGADGSRRIVLVTSKSIADNAGGSAGWVGTLADVTAEVEFEAAMEDARDKATEASRLKSDFLANMSHEIRTPMNGVIGMTDLLLETELDLHQRDYAQTVRNSGEALLTIINDILDFSKVEAGKLEIEDIDFSIRDHRGQRRRPAGRPGPDQGSRVDRHGVERRTGRRSGRPGPGAPSPGQPHRQRPQVHPERRNRRSMCRSLDATGDDALIRFEVSDTGDGIAPEKLELIFQPFVQADTSTSRKYGGTGLGLAISGELVALMGGESGVTSELGTGSTFWFAIHFQADAAPAELDPPTGRR